MRKLLRVSALLMVVMLALLASRAPGALAQDEGTPEAEGILDDLNQVEGLERAVERDWSFDYEALFDQMSSPDASSDPSDFQLPEGVQYVTAVVMEFDSAENAESTFTKMTDEIENESDDMQFEELEVEGLPNNTIALSASETDEDLGDTTTAVIASQEDEYLYISIGVAISDDPSGQVTDLVKSMVDADVGDGDGEFNEDGSSEGGLWDKLPDAENDIVSEDLVVSDVQLFPETDDAAA